MDKRPESNEEILNECLEAILRGEPIDSCLERYPQQAQELRPLLKTMTAARDACRIAPRPEFRARARYEYNSAVTDACTKRASRGFRWSWRWSTAIPVALAVMMVSGGGVMAASANSIPGQPLYGVKLALEQVQVNLTPNGEAKAKVYAALAERRVSEIVALSNSGNAALTGETTLKLEDNLNKITDYMGVNGEVTGQQRNSETYESVSPPSFFYPATAGIQQEDAADANKDVSLAAPGGETVTNFSNIDPALLDLLKDYAARDQAKLMEVLESLPESNRLVLQHVLDSYGIILNTQNIQTDSAVN